MIPERDYFLAKAETRRRQEEAEAARLVREARREDAARHREQAGEDGESRSPTGALGWLRRLAGAR